MTSIASNSKSLVETSCLNVLAIGPWERGEFKVVSSQIGELDLWSVVPDCESASELLASDEFVFDAILMAEPLPATYRQADIEQLRRLAPLAQIVVVAGSWCEGELRTGNPQFGVLRLYWHEVVPWWQARLNQSGDWQLTLDGPMTPRGDTAEISLEAAVVIHSPLFAGYEALSAALCGCGANCTWARDTTSFSSGAIGIWDGGQLDQKEWQALQHFATKLCESGGKLIVLLDFPRKEHIARLRSLGCETVFGKPYVLSELVAAISRLG